MHLPASVVALVAAADAVAALRVLPVGISKPTSSALRRRTNTYSEALSNNVSLGSYLATVQVGTPPQTLQLAIDTGSSDVWMLETSTNLCTSERLQNEYGPCLTPFNPSKSSTYKVVSQNSFRAEYADGSAASGNYISDTFSIGGATLSTLQMGLATQSQLSMGLLGIGFDSNEASVGNSIYPNLVDTMVSSGLIAVRAYSLYLDDIETSSGTILFGGVDTEKYIGSLTAVPMEPSSGGLYVDFTVALSSLSGSTGGNSASYLTQAIPVVLDSGTTLTYLPSDVASSVFQQFNAYDDSNNSGFVYVNCNYLTSASTFTFNYQFGGSSGPTVSVPIDEIIQNDVQQYLGLGGGLELPPDLNIPTDQVCSFGIQGSDQIYLLGDTFLRSAYVVYDLDNHQIALAQTNFNSTQSHVVEMASNSSGIPNVSGVASQVTVIQSATGLPGPGRESSAPSGTDSGDGVATVTVTAGASSKSAAGTGPPAASFEAVAVAAVAGFFALLGGAMMVL